MLKYITPFPTNVLIPSKYTYVPKAALVLLQLDMAWNGINIFKFHYIHFTVVSRITWVLNKTDNYVH